MLHQLDHQVLISLIVVSDQIVDALKKCRQSAAVVFFLEQELLLGEYLHQVDETIASLSAKLLCVGCQVGNDSDDALVDGFEEARSRLDQLVDGQEDQVVVGH